MSIPDGAAEILGRLREQGYEAYVVGGCVRDSMLGRKPHDWDICTSALPRQIKEVFEGRFKQRDTGISHGTVMLLTETGPVEVTTFRRDGKYTDHRRPDSVQLGVPLRMDLARRDFTINAMAMDEAGDIVDLFDGKKDLAGGLIRCVGVPRERFNEDALRILRALRFASQLDFVIDPETMTAALTCAPLLRRVAKERVFTELDLLLQGPGAGRILAESGAILAQVIPEIGRAMGFDLKSPVHNRDLWGHTAAAVALAPPVRLVRWTLLLHDLAKPDCFVVDQKGIGHAPGHGMEGCLLAEQILRRLKAPVGLIGTVKLLVKHHDAPLIPKEINIRRWLAKLGPNTLNLLVQVKRADLGAHAQRSEVSRRQAQLEQFARMKDEILATKPCLRLEDMVVNGRDLIRGGYCKPGPQTGRMLNRLLYQVVDGLVPNEKEAILAAAAQIRDGTDQK